MTEGYIITLGKRLQKYYTKNVMSDVKSVFRDPLTCSKLYAMLCTFTFYDADTCYILAIMHSTCSTLFVKVIVMHVTLGLLVRKNISKHTLTVKELKLVTQGLPACHWKPLDLPFSPYKLFSFLSLKKYLVLTQ